MTPAEVLTLAGKCLVLFGICWAIARAFPEPPEGTDPEYWRTVMRRRRRQLQRRLGR